MFRQFAFQRTKHLEDDVWVHGMEPLLEKIFVARDALRQQLGERVAKQEVDDGMAHGFVDFRRQKYFFSSNCNHLEFMRHTHKECCNFAASLSLVVVS